MRRTALGVMVGAAALVLGACGERDAATARGVPAAGKITATPADTDVKARGGAVPRGYVAITDQQGASIGDAAYTQREPGRWEVRTGPAHILYQPGDSASGKYSVSATFEQLEAPTHPEAFGVFVGGSRLDDPAARRYTYFIVRGDGKFMVKVRDGGETRTVVPWTAHPGVPKQDASGRALYGMKVDVDGGTARVSVNGVQITTISASQGPLDGVAGVRINHNLHLVVTPVSITR